MIQHKDAVPWNDDIVTSSNAANSAPSPPLYIPTPSNRILLRSPLVDYDAQSLLPFYRDSETVKWMGDAWSFNPEKGEQPKATLEKMRKFLEGFEEGWEEKSWFFTVVLNSGQKEQGRQVSTEGSREDDDKEEVIGWVGLLKEPSAPLTCDLGILFGRPFWHKGFAPEALQTLAYYGYYNLGLEKITLQTREGNENMIGWMERLGYGEGRKGEFEGRPWRFWEIPRPPKQDQQEQANDQDVGVVV